MKTTMLIYNIRIALPDGKLMNGEILIKEGKINQISDFPINDFDGERIDGRGSIALPGFIDIHIHGADGADFMDGSESAFAKIAQALPREGTTSFLATTMTQATGKIQQAIDAGFRYLSKTQCGKGAEFLGYHLEGPFIAPEKAGAQPRDFIQKPSVESIEQWFGKKLEHLKIVTLAPERDSQNLVIKHLADKGIIMSAGHTIATQQEIQTAIEHGLTHLTHFGNAMRGLHQREIGVIGAGLLHDQLYCELIADGIHVSDDMMKLMMKVIGPDRLLLITDSMRAKGLADGIYTLADQQVKVSGDKATLEDDSLAGSLLKMNEGIKRLRLLSDLSLHEVMKMSSVNAAKRLGIFDRKGSIEEGKDADIVILNEAFDVRYTICRGRLSYAYDVNKVDSLDSGW
ncbi:N-acetylglucosamine-6-phosphate deacetylase [Planococcus beigongshangi]|uniref:N-acetylglucosamine-6-phosphate deacetylase n=1 Tax=Planococcus beigongshangi TaxID=2782536 RepID=UPI00193BD1B7|nr:N-acetylglucosamine-6-phosphate deacetylase [Planococcus beigongshangi]